MWGWIKRAARAVGNFVRGVANAVFQAVKWVVHTVVGLLDGILTLIGWMPWKKISVQGVILVDEKREPLADRDAVQAVIDLAASVFADQMHVRLIQPGHVTILAEIPPKDVLEPGCDASILGAQFTSVGAWFRSHQWPSPAGTFLGYGHPVTVFVVRDVIGKMGCAPPGFLADYAVIDPDALSGDEGARLTLAHEVGHACNLWHWDGTLMKKEHSGRPRTLRRWQKALFRGSPHVTYL